MVTALDELPLPPSFERSFALQFPAPVVAVLRLDPAAITRQVTPRAPFRDDAFQFALADGSPEGLDAVVGVAET
jgi:hypothetical protein